MNLQEALDLFLGQYDQKPDTRRAYQSSLRKLMAALGADQSIEQVTKLDLEHYRQTLQNATIQYADHPRRKPLEAPPSPNTIRKHIKAMKCFFRYLYRLELIPRNPAEFLKVSKDHPAIEWKDIPTRREVEFLKQSFWGNPQRYALFSFLVDTGCRAMGLVGLQFSELDLFTRKAYVTEKAGASYWVYFSEETYFALSRWLKQRPDWSHEFVFGHKKGAFKSDYVSQLLRRECEKLGIRKLSAHQFRYLKATDLALAGVDEKIISRVLGHNDNGEMARKFYILVRQHQVEAASRLTHRQKSKKMGRESVAFFPDLLFNEQ